jgi:hypothetical protein
MESKMESKNLIIPTKPSKYEDSLIEKYHWIKSRKDVNYLQNEYNHYQLMNKLLWHEMVNSNDISLIKNLRKNVINNCHKIKQITDAM